MEDAVAIIQIPDDQAIVNCVENRSSARDVGVGKAWENESIIGEITSRTTPNRRIVFLNGTTTLARVRKLTIIGHGSSFGWLIGPYSRSQQTATAPIMPNDMAVLLINAGYAGGYSIDVLGCFSADFAQKLSGLLPGIYVKGYTDPITIEQDLFPMVGIGGPKTGKAVIVPHPKGAPEGQKGKKRYLNGQPVDPNDYAAQKHP
jgi:hypothetical protein